MNLVPPNIQRTDLIYLAAPYSDPNPWVVAQRMLNINITVAELFKREVMTFSPLTMCHPVAKISNLGTCYETWKAFNRLMIRKSDYLVILELPGWGMSKGVLAEYEFARSLGIVVYRLEFPTLQFHLCHDNTFDP